MKMIPDIPVPTCSKYDGLYEEIQTSPFFGWTWCVDRFSGKEINGTVTREPGVLPLCPSKQLSFKWLIQIYIPESFDQIKAHAYLMLRISAPPPPPLKAQKFNKGPRAYLNHYDS